MSKNEFIPLSIPSIEGNEWSYIKDCLDKGWVSSAGSFVDQFEKNFSKYVGSKHAIACSSGTAALHVALQLAGVKKGDLVLAPSLTFIASINAICYLGAEALFFDSDDFYNIDAQKLKLFFEQEVNFSHGNCLHKKTGRKISAILPVHIFGNAVDISWLLDFCLQHNLPMIEDATESLGTRYKQNASNNLAEKHTGTLGKFGCFSFNGNKIMTTGGGGMIVTNDDSLAAQAKYLTTQAKNDELYFIHDEVGYNYRLTNIQAALGVAQLELLPKFLEKKEKIYNTYVDGFKNISGIEVAPVPNYANNNYWLSCIRIDEKKYGESRDQLMLRLKNANIQARPIWHLNHMQKPFKHFIKHEINNAQKLLEKSLSIPSSSSLSDSDQFRVIEVIRNA